jgi:hypothetical protein
MKELFLPCECGSEILRVVYDEEDKEYYFSFYSIGHTKNNPLIYKLKMIWRIITKGSPYEDNIILNLNECEKLVNFLDERNK